MPYNPHYSTLDCCGLVCLSLSLHVKSFSHMSIKVSLVQPYDNDGQWLMDWWISYSSASDGPCTKKIPPWNTSWIAFANVNFTLSPNFCLPKCSGFEVRHSLDRL